MRKLWLVGCVVFGVATSGCAKDVTKDMEALADRACACKDAKCATAVIDDLVTLADKNKSARGDEDRAKKAAERIGMCAVQAGVDLQTLQSKLDKLGN